MSENTTANEFADRVGKTDDETYSIAWGEMAKLIAHANRLGAAKLAMLRSLQSALPRGAGDQAADLKELLSNIIIMQTRLAEREAQLNESISALSSNPPVSRVTSDRDAIAAAAEEILSAACQIRSEG